MSNTQPNTTPTQTSSPAANQAAANKPEATEKNRYRNTLNLPQTTFPMKASLVQNEPASLKRWQGMKLYDTLRAKRKTENAKPFVFHDGPPYANGNLHLGHLLNKCLKDFVVRSRGMMGFDCPYVPGWDCHGLPIEHKVVSDLQEKGKLAKLATLPDDQRKTAIRRECQAHAEKYVKLQRGQMERFLTLADYEHPYLTLQPSFEGATLEVLAELCEQGLVYRGLKPVHWSIANETALAEAELEYQDREDLSVYVDFEAENADAVYDAFGLKDDDEQDEDAEADENASKAPKPGTRPLCRPSFMIWTTTPWTLPANLAIAVNPKFEYACVWADGAVTVLAAEAVDRVMKKAATCGHAIEEYVVLGTTTGEKLLGLKYKHPFVANTDGTGSDFFRKQFEVKPNAPVHSIVGADYVTLEDGTGLVHTAPGHGTEDYQTGQAVGLPAYCPVRENGTYDDSVPQWLRGQSIWKANAEVANHLRTSGHLFLSHKFTHSYPHDWRSKTPVIFRCTHQWFVGVDLPTKWNKQSLRAMALDSARVGPLGYVPKGAMAREVRADQRETQREVESHGGTTANSDSALPKFDNAILTGVQPAYQSVAIDFIPLWGANRMLGMLESRPDWCISRQRSWGMPIPAFTRPDGSVFMTAASVRAVAKLVREKGTDIWFSAGPEELLKYYNAATDPDDKPGVELSALKKGGDIVDVWFESGSTWNACMRERGLGFPMDLYLEGSDQHRGWFQSSLLPSLGVTGVPPFKTLLTHGFIVDKDGKKLSKSRPDAAKYEVEALCNDFGMDVMRWWVASLPYENDIKADLTFFAEYGESYRKVRNTLRFMLSNLSDFTASRDGVAGHCVPSASIKPTTLDAWVLSEFDALAAAVEKGYENYDFRSVQQRLYDFCNDTLSSVYLAAAKDRLYCDKVDAPRRRQTQTVLWDLTDGLCKLLAPILPHTADEAYRALHRVDAKDTSVCVHLDSFVRSGGKPGFGAVADEGWAKVMSVRGAALQAIEQAKATLGVENPLDMQVTLPDPDGLLARFDAVDLADLLGVSRVRLEKNSNAPSVQSLASEPRCERSWKRDGTVRARSDGGMLSDRDAAAVGVA